MTLFERATRQNYLFESSKGNLNVTDLWNLPLTSKRGASLNNIALNLDSQISALGAKSFVKSESASPERKLLTDKLEVVKRIIQVRETENAARAAAREKEALREQLQAALATKQAEHIASLSEEELQARLAALADA